MSKTTLHNEDKYLKLSDEGFNQVQKKLSSSSLVSGNFTAYNSASSMQKECLDEIIFVESEVVVVDQR